MRIERQAIGTGAEPVGEAGAEEIEKVMRDPMAIKTIGDQRGRKRAGEIYSHWIPGYGDGRRVDDS